MRILVTGGGGFLGQALCRGLVERGHAVTSFNRGHYPELDAIGVRQVRGDLADAAAVRCAGHDRGRGRLDAERVTAELRAAFPEGGSVRRQATALLATCDTPTGNPVDAGVRTAGR